MKDTNLIMGKKNTGKTKGILFKEVKDSIEKNENLFIYNDRDEYYRTFSKILKENNYNILTLNLKDASKSNGYNPLLLPYQLYKENKLDEAISMVNNLALEIFKEDGNHDPFWENMASNYFTGLTLILFNEANINEINLGSVQVMISQGELKYNETTYLKSYLENIDVTNTIYTLLSPIVFAPNDTKGSILSVTKQKLNNYLIREQLLNLLNTNDINLKELNNKTAMFVIGKEEINDLANIFINQLVNITNIPFTFIFDNFDSLRKVSSFNELVKDASYNGNKVYVAIHNEEEFKEIYKKSIMDQFENVMYMENNNINEFEKLGNDFEYPLLEITKHNYFNFKNFIENK